MEREEALGLFEEMIVLAKTELHKFTKSQKLDLHHKADKTIVTGCDSHIDKVLSDFASTRGLFVISEEGAKQEEIVQSGNYLTIDPIDGTLGYIEYVNYALEHKGIDSFLSEDLGPDSDFCLLIGIVENSIPKYGCCFHYVTQEKIFLDAQNPDKCIIQNNKRKSSEKFAVYISPRPGEAIQQKIIETPGVTTIKQATLGLKSLYTILNKHEDAATIHMIQGAGLWDILPASIACRAFGGILLDGNGNEVVFNKYIILPGKGAVCIKGRKFLYVQDELKKQNS